MGKFMGISVYRCFQTFIWDFLSYGDSMYPPSYCFHFQGDWSMVLATHWHIKKIITRLSQKLRPQSIMMFYDVYIFFYHHVPQLILPLWCETTYIWRYLDGSSPTLTDTPRVGWWITKAEMLAWNQQHVYGLWSSIPSSKKSSDRFTIYKSLWLTFLPRGLSIQSKFDLGTCHVVPWVPLEQDSDGNSRDLAPKRFGNFHTQWNPSVATTLRLFFTTCQIHVNLFEDSSPHTFAQTLGAHCGGEIGCTCPLAIGDLAKKLGLKTTCELGYSGDCVYISI